jgi:hypothetical protein
MVVEPFQWQISYQAKLTEGGGEMLEEKILDAMAVG